MSVPPGSFTGALASLALASCAFGDVTLKPVHPVSVATGSRRGEGREVVFVRPFANERAQTRCGMKRNGFGSDTANVLCAGLPEIAISDLIAGDLSRVGFRVLDDWRQVGPSTLVIRGELLQAFLEPKQNFYSGTIETDFGLTLTATNAQGLLATRRFYVKGTEATFLGVEAELNRSFTSGVRQLVTSVVGAVANLADRIPHTAPSTVQAEAPGVTAP